MTEDFELANRAFDLFTLTEREQALREFARLCYPSIQDRFFEAVHIVIKRDTKKEAEQRAMLIDAETRRQP